MLQGLPDNTLNPEDIGCIFGAAFVGGRRQSKESVVPPCARCRTRRSGARGSCRWPIKYWSQISEAYESDDDGPGGQRPYILRIVSTSTPRATRRMLYHRKHNGGVCIAPYDSRTWRRILGGGYFREKANGEATYPSSPSPATTHTPFSRIDIYPLGRHAFARTNGWGPEIQGTAPRRSVDDKYMSCPIPRLDIPQGKDQARLFEMPASFDFDTANDAGDDASVYLKGMSP